MSEQAELPEADLVDVLGPALVDTLLCEGWEVRAEVAQRLLDRLIEGEATLDRVRRLPATLGTVSGPAILERDLVRALSRPAAEPATRPDGR